MSIYVDVFLRYGKKKWCHMTADSLEELHDMADKIGLKKEWFQNKSQPHYDIVPSKRFLAVDNGAIEITVREAGKRHMEYLKKNTTKPKLRGGSNGNR